MYEKKDIDRPTLYYYVPSQSHGTDVKGSFVMSNYSNKGERSQPFFCFVCISLSVTSHFDYKSKNDPLK